MTHLTPVEETCLIFAARYAHDRNTGAALTVVNAALRNWDAISDRTKEQLYNEARQEAMCNLDDWYRLYQKYESEKVPL